MLENRLTSIASDEIWTALQKVEPERTAKTEARKTPRTTAMRDLRKDSRFIVRKGTIRLTG
jgi:hypothetical protein